MFEGEHKLRPYFKISICYDWPGNVRELRSAIEYAFVLCQGNEIGPEHLPYKVVDIHPDCHEQPLSIYATTNQSVQADNEQEKLIQAFKQTQGNQSKAAKF